MTRAPSPARDLVSFVRWVKFLRRERPEAVFIGTPKASLLGMVAARLVRVPTRIYQLHGLRLETVRPGLPRFLLALLERLTFACATSAVAVSPSLVRKVVEMGLNGRTEIICLGQGSCNGVDMNRFAVRGLADSSAVASMKQQLGLLQNVPTIGFVGRVNRDKGLQHLLDASNLLQSSRVPHQLLIVGDIEDAALGAELRRSSSSSRHIALPGRVEGLEYVYATMDVHCLPTLREGFGSVVLEASSAAIPTVTTNATGAVDTVEDGRTGLVVPKGDPVALAQALSSLLRDQTFNVELGLAARERASESFAREDVLARAAEYIESRLGKDPSIGKAVGRG